jgi:Zn-dependent M32 family carboxypeptidase
VRPQPPSDPQRRKEYGKLLGKAKRVEHTSPKQAAYLRARARQLEEVLISAPAPTIEELTYEQADCPAMWRTPQARGLVPVQLALIASPQAMGTT